MGDLGDALELLRWKSSPPLPDLTSFSEECLSAAEEAAEHVVNCIHPTLDSEEKRRDVIDYIQRLIKTHLRCEVFPYGSVPLKTYLPDGDIDLTVLKVPNPGSLALDVLAVLQREEQNEDAEYQVTDTQFIDAEVKLVKCLVQNFIIDISFNQLGGLSTLCFLEQVDRIIGRNHLFKRSIILVKTWCYHESRILGAYHGLISTYALEALVLYIFHLFHSSLSGPLMVLYRFLSYYSQFDWENYCVSLKGPVLKSSLPDIVVKLPESGWGNLMFTDEYLENCMDMFSVPLKGLEEKPKAFQGKHLNIMDPLKENNNLGRSVSRGNFYRIQSAFKYGARKLGQLLLRPRDKIADEVTDFFANTLTRHGHQYRYITQHSVLRFGDEESLTISASSPVEVFSEDEILVKSSVNDFDLFSKHALDRYSMGEISEEASEASSSADSSPLKGERLDRSSSNLSLRNGTSSYVSSSKNSVLNTGNHYLKRQYFSSNSSVENGSSQTGKSRRSDLVDTTSHKRSLKPFSENQCESYNNTYKWCMENSRDVRLIGSDSSTLKANSSENISLGFGEVDSAITGESEAFNPLADLNGNYDCHIRSLLHGQLCHGLTLSAPKIYNHQSLLSRIENKKAWDIVRQSMPLMRNQLSLINSPRVYAERSVCSSAESAMPSAFPAEAKRKPQRTGTYLLNGIHWDRHQRRSINRAPGNCNKFHEYGHGNGVFHVLNKEKYLENDTHEVLPLRSNEKLDVELQSPPSVSEWHQTNGFDSESCRIEFGSVGNLAEEVISGLARDRGSTTGASVERRGAAPATKQENEAVSSMFLENDDEFPPLR